MRRFIAVFRAAAAKFSQDGCAFLAQAIAFNALFAIFPILVLIVSALSFIYGNEEAQQRALALVASIAPNVQETLTENIHQVNHFRGISGLVALITLIWSGKNLFMALAYALDRALNIPKGRPLHLNIAVALILLPIVGVLMIIATTLPVVLSFIIRYGGLPHSAVSAQVIWYSTATLLIFTTAVLLYAHLPSKRPATGLRFGIPGALFVAVSWEAAQIAFSVYTTHINFLGVYGAVSAIAILLLWFYYMGVIFLFGAELSAQWEAHRASLGVTPRRCAVPRDRSPARKP
jgi:membrane protein